MNFVSLIIGISLSAVATYLIIRFSDGKPRTKKKRKLEQRAPKLTGSEWNPQVIQLGKLGKHPNADTLSITHVLGRYPVVCKTDDWKEGDRAIYIPVDTILPDEHRWAWLGDSKRIKAKKLRGFFSMGFIEKLEPNEHDWEVGKVVVTELRLKKYEPPIYSATHGANVSGPTWLPWPTYDLESIRRFPHILQDGEQVTITEKIHGSNGRFVFSRGELHVGSHRCWKAPPADGEQANVWWQIASKYELAAKLDKIPDYVVYGEVYGYVQDLQYGAMPGEVFLAIFDIRDPEGNFLPFTEVEDMCKWLGLQTVPVLYRGPWRADCEKLAEGSTTIEHRAIPSNKRNHIREGIVIQAERFSEIGRVKLKLVGEGYLTRKEGISPIMANAPHRAA